MAWLFISAEPETDPVAGDDGWRFVRAIQIGDPVDPLRLESRVQSLAEGMGMTTEPDGLQSITARLPGETRMLLQCHFEWNIELGKRQNAWEILFIVDDRESAEKVVDTISHSIPDVGPPIGDGGWFMYREGVADDWYDDYVSMLSTHAEACILSSETRRPGTSFGRLSI